MCFQSTAQLTDTLFKNLNDTSKPSIKYQNLYSSVLDSNIFLRYKGTAQALDVTIKKQKNTDDLFFIFITLFLVFGLLRTIFSRYFTTMFRVFFNTSLRQNQLTDQLEQAALPSLLFNIFFVLSIGLYMYNFYEKSHLQTNNVQWFYLMQSVLAVAICYAIKFVSVLFTGWLTNRQAEAKIYIFSIFLLNKIIGLLLLPLSMLIAFSTKQVAEYATIFSFILLGILLVSRFFRTYGLLRNRLKLNGFHFLIYIISLEILPIILVYKTAVVFFGINV